MNSSAASAARRISGSSRLLQRARNGVLVAIAADDTGADAIAARRPAPGLGASMPRACGGSGYSCARVRARVGHAAALQLRAARDRRGRGGQAAARLRWRSRVARARRLIGVLAGVRAWRVPGIGSRRAEDGAIGIVARHAGSAAGHPSRYPRAVILLGLVAPPAAFSQ